MRIHCYLSGNPVHDRLIRAFSCGIGDGNSVLLKNYRDYEPADLSVMFGMFKKDVPISFPRKKIFEGGPCVVIDSGYIRRGEEKDSYYAVGLNGLNGRADFKNQGMPPDRWKALGVDMKPWREGKTVLVCGQVPWDASVQNINIIGWCQEVVNELRRHTDRRIVFRPHPRAKVSVEGAENSARSLEEDLAEAHACVTWNSNAGVDAALAGVPVFAFDAGSMVLRLANHHLECIENPMTPDRTGWANDIAYAQWTPTEIAEGKCWRHLFE